MATAVLSIDIEARIANLEANFQRATKLAKDFGAGMASGSTQATAAGEKLIATLKDQIATFGLSGTQLQAYRAAQEGVAQQATLLVRVLDNLGNAEKRKAELQQSAVAADRERGAASQQFVNSQQQMVAGLQREIDVFGKAAAEVRLMDAAMIGAANSAAPLIARLEALRNAASEQAKQEALAGKRAALTEALVAERDAIGKSASELKLMSAAQIGATETAAPLIAQINQLRLAERERAAATAQENALVERRTALTAALTAERDAIGKSASELKLMAAAQIGATESAGPLIAQIDALRNAAKEQAEQTALAGKREALTASLVAERDAIGKSASELRLMAAAQIGAAESAGPLIAQINQLRQAEQERVAATTEQNVLVGKREALTAALTAERDAIGKSASELKLMQAAQIGATETATPLIAQIERLREAERDAAAATAQQAKGNQFVDSLNREVTAIGKTRTELLALKAAELGVAEQAKPMIDQLRRIDEGASGQFGRMAAGARRASFEQQQLGYQLHDFFVQVTSGQSPLTAFVQQGSQLSGTFGGAVPAIKAVLGLLTPMNVILGASAVAVGGLGYAWYKGAEESEAFNKALVLTGNYAGITADKMQALALSTSSATQTHVGAAREILAGLVETGRFTSETLGTVAEAGLALQKNTGESTKKILEDFARMTDGVTKWAEEHNKQYHFLTAAELEHIRVLEEEGNKTTAYGIVAAALNEHLKNQNTNVGYLIGAWRSLGIAVSGAWDSMKSIGRDTSVGDQISAMEKKLTDARARINAGQIAGGAVDDSGRRAEQSGEEVLAIEKRLAFLRLNQSIGAHLSEMGAKKKQDEEKLHEDGEYLRKQEEQFRTNAEKRKKEIDDINKRADDMLAKGGEFSAERRAKLIANVEEKYKDKKGPKDDPTKALLTNRLKDYEHAVAEESEMHAAYNKLVDFYYSQNLISIEDYYAARNQRDADGLKLKLDAYDKEIEAVRAHQAKTGKAVERAEDEGKINDLLEKKRKLTLEAQLETVVGSAKEVAALKSLTDQINEMNGALQRLTGNKGEGAGAAFDKQYADLKKKLEVEKNTGALENLDVLRRETVAQGELNDKTAEGSLIYEKLRNTEQNIALARQFGTLTELESLSAVGAARQRSIAQLQAIVVEQERIAASSSSDKLKIEAEKARLEFDKLRASADVLGDKFRTLFSDDLSGPLTDFLDGTKSAKDAFTSFAKSVVHDINSIAAKQIAQDLFGSGTKGGDAAGWIGRMLSGRGGGSAGGFGGPQTIDEGAVWGQGSGGGGVWGAVFDKINGLFGAGKSSGVATNFGGGAASTAAEDFIGKIAGGGGAPQAPVNSTGFLSTILGSLGGLKKGDSPTNPLYVSSVSGLLGLAGGTGIAGASGGTGAGGLLSTAGSLVSKYFESAGGSAAAGAAASGAAGYAAPTGEAASFLFDMLAGAAGGGQTTPGWFMAGEEGPELIRTKAGAKVYNNRDTNQILSAQRQGDSTVNHNYNINVEPPAGTDRRTALQWGEAIGQTIRGAGRNG